ncbi:MAG: hypothetical protein J6M02_02000 [Clostridia bacterium]|nr:hypothetical protein [Clostridia bacterium]
MMNLKERNDWLKLYEIAKDIKALRPQEYLSDFEWLQYESKKYEETFYFCIIELFGEINAIGIYTSEQLHRFYELIDNDFPSYMMLNYQEGLMCRFDSREDTLKENRALIKELGLRFRGTWISFEHLEKGYQPATLNSVQVNKMIEILSNLYNMLKQIKEEKLTIDFEAGETLIRAFDEEKKEYVNKIDKLLVPDIELRTIIFEGQEKKRFKADVTKIPKKNMSIEFEFLNYFPLSLKDVKENGRFYFPKIRFIADHTKKLMYEGDMIDKNNYEGEQEYIDETLDLLVRFFFEFGRPKRIYVRDIETKVALQEIADLANIEVTIKSKLKVIDEFLEEFIRFNGGR